MKEPKICLLVDDDPDDQEVFLTALGDVSTTALCLVAPDGDRAHSFDLPQAWLAPGRSGDGDRQPRVAVDAGRELLAE